MTGRSGVLKIIELKESPVPTKTYFQASDSTHGTELWVTDGTTAGTSFIADIYPGTGGSYPTDFAEAGTAHEDPKRGRKARFCWIFAMSWGKARRHPQALPYPASTRVRRLATTNAWTRLS